MNFILKKRFNPDSAYTTERSVRSCHVPYKHNSMPTLPLVVTFLLSSLQPACQSAKTDNNSVNANVEGKKIAQKKATKRNISNKKNTASIKDSTRQHSIKQPVSKMIMDNSVLVAKKDSTHDGKNQSGEGEECESIECLTNYAEKLFLLDFSNIVIETQSNNDNLNNFAPSLLVLSRESHDPTSMSNLGKSSNLPRIERCDKDASVCEAPESTLNDQDELNSDVKTLLFNSLDLTQIDASQVKMTHNELNGSLPINDNFYLTGHYNAIELDDDHEFNLDITKYSIGAGFSIPVNREFSFTSSLSYDHYLVGYSTPVDNSEEYIKGYTVTAGASTWITNHFQVSGNITIQEFELDELPHDDAGFNLGARINLQNNAWVGYHLNADDDNTHLLEIRFEF